jgi:hypothetical protein
VDIRFVQYLLRKPDSYVLVWCFIYATARDGSFIANYSSLLSRFKLSRTSLQRIIDYGCEFVEDGQKVGRKWAGNELTITLTTKISGQKVGKKRAESTQGSIPFEPSEKKGNDVLKQALQLYNDFCIQNTGIGSKIDGLQTKSMKSILSYLHSQVKDQSNADVEVVNALAYIFTNWSNIDPFYQKQIKLNQINSNLPNILVTLRKSKNHRNDKYTSSSTAVRPEDFDGPVSK